MDEGLGWMVEEMGREELLEEVHRLKVMVSLDKPGSFGIWTHSTFFKPCFLS